MYTCINLNCEWIIIIGVSWTSQVGGGGGGGGGGLSVITGLDYWTDLQPPFTPIMHMHTISVSGERP